MRLVRHTALLVALGALVVPACAAAAGAGGAPASAGSSASLCSVAKSVAESFTTVPSLQTLSSPQAQATLKANLGKLVAAKGALVSAAPKKLKSDIRQVIGFYSLAKTDMTKAHWSIAALEAKPKLVSALEAKDTKAKPSFLRLKRYFNTTCHYK